jgi:tRNA threonylcarbamoyl adenosine modification protein YjeE
VQGHVPSPTFTLVQAYEAGGVLVSHFDLYRIENAGEMTELGMEDALDQGVVLVEWPERGFPARLATDGLTVTLLQTSADAREAHISGPKRWMRHIGGAVS